MTNNLNKRKYETQSTVDPTYAKETETSGCTTEVSVKYSGRDCMNFAYLGDQENCSLWPISKNIIIFFYVQAQPYRGVIIQVSFVRMTQWNSEYM